MNQLDEAEFEMEALFLAVVQLVEGAEHDLQEAGEVFFRKENGGARGTGRRSTGVHPGAEDHHGLAARAAAGETGVSGRLRTKPSDISEGVERRDAGVA